MYMCVCVYVCMYIRNMDVKTSENSEICYGTRSHPQHRRGNNFNYEVVRSVPLDKDFLLYRRLLAI